MVVANPLVVFLTGLVAVIGLMVWLDVPAFPALIVSTFIVGIATTQVPLSDVLAETAAAFGDTLVGIGIPILMAAIIGKTMMESGAGERIIRFFRGITGEDKSYFALWGSSGVMVISVFLDNVFFLLAPLARSMRVRTERDYALFITAVCGAGAVTHSFIPPTPGPLAASIELGVDVGLMILVGLVVGIPTAIASGVIYANFLNRHLDIPLHETMGTATEEMQKMADRPKSELPGLFEAFLPIILAVVLIASETTINALIDSGAIDGRGAVETLSAFFGDANFALTAAAATASAITYLRIRSLSRDVWSDEFVEALHSGGHIAAITGGGGAFGAMLGQYGVGEYVATFLDSVGLPLLLAGFVIAAAMRIAQGSATVAILTGAGIMATVVPDLGIHPVYLALAIGAGGATFSWQNNSGFWVIKEIGGLTQLETVKIYTVLTTINSVIGFVLILILSTLFPLT